MGGMKLLNHFQNFNGCTVEVWELVSNCIAHFYNGCNYVFMLGLKLIHVSKKGYWYLNTRIVFMKIRLAMNTERNMESLH